MTLSTQTSKISFSGNGVTTAFPLPFPFARDADIRALLLKDNVETPLAHGTHYTLAGAGAASGGSLAMLAPPATGSTLVIWRAPAIVQEVDYVENAAFPAETHEAALDLLTMICQSLQEQLGRAVLYPVSTPAGEIMDSAAFLGATTANKAASQLAQAEACAARDAAQGHALGAEQSATAAARSALEAAQIATGGIPDASATVRGAVRLATAAEVAAGTDTQKAVTPAGLKPALDAKLDASGALSAIGGAARGANSDITALSGLTTPLSIAQGGTGATSAAGVRAALGLADSSALGVMNALFAWRTHVRASGPVPAGYVHALLTDELATKTGASYNATGKYYANDASTTPAYANAGGTGDRRASITVTANFTFSGTNGNQGLIDGADNSLTFPTLMAVAGKYVQFDFGAGAKKLFDKVRFRGSYTANEGTWKLQVSNNAADWTDCSSGFVWCSAATLEVACTAATGGWRYLRVLGVSGTTVDNGIPAVYEVEFSIGESAVSDMTLAPAAVTTAAHPSSVTLRFLHKAIDAVAYNTDLKARVSTDGGASWSGYGSIAKLCAFDADYDLLEAVFDTSGLGGTSLKPEISTCNTKGQRVAGIALGYSA